jgi:hypothetical protein
MIGSTNQHSQTADYSRGIVGDSWPIISDYYCHSFINQCIFKPFKFLAYREK